MRSRPKDLWERRELMFGLVRRDLRQSTVGLWLGWGWWLLDPLILMGIYWFLVLAIGQGTTVEAFPVFVLCGLTPWKWAASSVGAAAGSLFRERSLIQTIAIPKAVLPLAGVLTHGVYAAFGVLLVGVIAAIVGRPITPAAIQAVLMLPLFGVLLCGLALIASAGTLIVRDLSNVVGYAFRLLLYASPIVYPLSRVEGLIGNVVENPGLADFVYVVYSANPLNIATQMVRGGLYEGVWVPGWMWFALAGEAVAALSLGAVLFWRVERWIIKVI